MHMPKTGEVAVATLLLSAVAAMGGVALRQPHEPSAEQWRGRELASAQSSREPAVRESHAASPATSTSVAEGKSLAPLGANVIRGRDHTGNYAGVDVYRGPNYTHSIGTYQEHDFIYVLCKASGRTFVNPDVPKGEAPVTSSQWYLLNAPNPQWIGGGHVKLRDGKKAPKCPRFAMKAAVEAPSVNPDPTRVAGIGPEPKGDGVGVYRPWEAG